MFIDRSQSFSSYIDEIENHIQEDVNVQIRIVDSLIAWIFYVRLQYIEPFPPLARMTIQERMIAVY